MKFIFTLSHCISSAVHCLAMTITNVQHVNKAASESLSAKFSDLCDPHDLAIHSPKRKISKISTKSRASSKALRQLRKHDRRSDFTSTDEEAYLMSLVPLKTEPSLYRLRRSFKLSRLGTPSPSHMKNCNSPQQEGHGVTKKLLKMCRVSSASKYSSLPVF